ncbi:MAG: sulfite exporter TauE/SafE family protein [Ilumatobacteraceae bacterium]
MTLALAALIGVGIGFLGGLLGKGGSAIATPLLHAIGIPAIVAVAAPLPATIPSTMVASYAYSRERLVDWRVVRWTATLGVPATVLGALLTRWISGGILVKVTDVVLVGLGIWILAGLQDRAVEQPTDEPGLLMLAAVAIGVGLVSGLLANSGGFLLAPLFVILLRLPIKSALASSLAVASVLAVPGTIVHAALGHIDWTLVVVFGSTSVPLSFLGARVALRTNPHRLEKIYGIALVVLGVVFLFIP